MVAWILIFCGGFVGRLQANGPRVECLSREEAAVAITDDAAEPYFCRLRTLEIGAKTGALPASASLDAAQECARRHYSAHVLDFNDEERTLISTTVASLVAAVSQEAPLLTRMPWRFLKVDGTVEGGLPHTRGSVIILSSPTLARYVGQGAKEGAFTELLLHEQIHVVQRMHPGIFDGIYTRHWGFSKAKRIAEHPWLVEHQLLNPDGTDLHWVVEIKEGQVHRWMWPLLLLRKPEDSGVAPQMPSCFRQLSLTLDKDPDGAFKVKEDEYGLPDFIDLYKDEGYLSRFGGWRHNLYHPHEAAASIFSRVLLMGSAGQEAIKGQGELLKSIRAALK